MPSRLSWKSVYIALIYNASVYFYNVSSFRFISFNKLLAFFVSLVYFSVLDCIHVIYYQLCLRFTVFCLIVDQKNPSPSPPPHSVYLTLFLWTFSKGGGNRVTVYSWFMRLYLLSPLCAALLLQECSDPGPAAKNLWCRSRWVPKERKAFVRSYMLSLIQKR